MARIFQAPDELPVPEPDYKNYDHEKEMARESKYLEDLKALLRSRDTGALVGEVVKTPQADSYACYMIASHRPFAMVHLPLGDAWRAPEPWERGMRLKDAKALIDHVGLSRLFPGLDGA